ncbi:outer membrane protein assembly factor BamC [Caldimonas thermodepolymerans]|uniref:outer membrane protein assembly factor BamC n=1 Tax=Caldimonas thermodepolymerans TaxID=215580 RepID=UPI002235CCAE|nr:outer membrane protein assembly factor BamC [Caldimonas thermodepolymerans]UZG43176.1 outer membrane protein assembly factor BamC [Caldimonas thermodepolymerans]
MSSVNAPLYRLAAPATRLTALALAAALAGCSSLGSMLEGDKVDYRSGGAKTARLEVPPDLTQLARDPRYQVPGSGSVSATAYQQQVAAAPAAAAATPVAPDAVGDVRIERAGNQRWLVTSQTPEQLWPQLKEFWEELGFNLTTDSQDTGVMETDWAENRAKLPMDIIRRTVGRVLDSLYSTGEMDRFRTRVERTVGGTEIFISHRRMEEVYTNQLQDQTRWQPAPADPELEAQILARLMVKLGAAKETKDAEAAVAAAPAAPERARVVSADGQPAVQVDDGFDRAWRRVGLSLDRAGFTVEDRDRAQGLYFVRYVQPSPEDGRREPGLLTRWFGIGGKAEDTAPARYRIAVRGDGEQRTLVSVQNAQGAPETGAVAQRIVQLLAEDLKR